MVDHRHRVWRLIGAAAALLAASPLTAQTVPLPSAIPFRLGAASSEPFTPRSAIVTIRLSPELGDDAAQIAADLQRVPFARIGEPADYELTTRPDFPQTLMLVHVGQPEADWERQVDSSASARAPSRQELGNIALGDYRAPLADALARIGRAQALLALDTRPEDVPAITCVAEVGQSPSTPDCRTGLRRYESLVEGGAVPMTGMLEPGAGLVFAVRNGALTPHYVALLRVDPDGGVTRVALKGDGPIAPGKWVESSGTAHLPYEARFWLVTIVSDQPVPADLLEEQAFGAASAQACAGSLGAHLCGMTPPPADDANPPHKGWAAAVAEYPLHRYRIEPIGGGISAPRYSAPWIAQLYSTIPYTPAEIAADDGKAPDAKEYLRERSEAERNHRCGGTLIASDLVLTAAHCVAKDNFAGAAAIKVLKARRIRLGTEALGREGATYAIDAMVVHAGYTGQETNDIALLHIRADSSTAGRTGTPIALLAGQPRTPGLVARAPVNAYGWGYTGVVAPGARPLLQAGSTDTPQHNPSDLQDGALEALGWATCKKRVGADLGPGMLCAVSRTDIRTGIAARNVFSCRGDSGGPLIRKVGAADMLVGIASWSRGCGYEGFPSIYTDVSKYAGWIDKAKAGMKPGAVTFVDAKGGVVAPVVPAVR